LKLDSQLIHVYICACYALHVSRPPTKDQSLDELEAQNKADPDSCGPPWLRQACLEMDERRMWWRWPCRCLATTWFNYLLLCNCVSISASVARHPIIGRCVDIWEATRRWTPRGFWRKNRGR